VASIGTAQADDFIVALDAGHGGSNYGAPTQSPEIFEKHITLSLAKKIQTILSKEKGLRVVLCRTTDTLIPIRTRVRCANRSKARLFLSLHANAAGPQDGPGSQRGFDLFILPVDEVEKEAARKGLLAESDDEAAWEGFRTRNHAIQSLAAARRIEWRLVDALGQDRNRGIKQKGATLDILQGLDMPAVLVEVGFLDHQEEGAFLLTEKAHNIIAQALAGAITDLRAREARGKREPMTTAPRPGHQDSEGAR
jgi:N-acetylmuramoyl-L-alanine amidase